MSSGDFYRQLFEEVSDAIVVYDPETAVVVDANPAVADLTGYSVEALVGRPVTQFSSGPPEEVERAAAELVDRAAERDQQFEWLVERADGEIRTAEVSLHRTEIDGDDRVLAILRDVTERERDRAALEESRQRLSLLTRHSPDVFWMFSADWKQCLFINDAYERIWGRSTDALEADPMDFLAGVHPDDRETVRDAIERLANGSRVETEYRVNEGEDFERWVWVEGVPIYEDGELTRHVGFARDITRRKRLVSDLREQNERLSALTENVPVVLFELDEDGVFVQSTGRGLDALGREPGQVVGQSIDEVYAGREEIRDACRRALDGESVSRTVELGDVVFDAWYEPAYDESGDVDGVIGVAVDVTERQRLESELRANERALTDLHGRASRTGLSMEERLRELLDIGRERLGLPIGFVTRIDGREQRVVEAVGEHEGLQPGATRSLEEAYCRRTIEREGLLGIRNAPEEGWADDAAYRESGLRCYLGGRLVVDGELYGTVCFASPEPRDRDFSDAERAFVELVVQWLGYEIERDRYESELESLTREVVSILEASPLAIIEVDASAVVRRWNDAAESLFGIPESEAVGTKYPAISESRRPVFEDLFERVMAGETVTGVEGSIERPDGTRRDLSINAAPVTEADDGTGGAVVTVTDVTGERRRQRRLDALRRATQRLVEAHTDDAVASIAVEAPSEAVGFPAAAVWRHDETTDSFDRLAATDAWRELVGEGAALSAATAGDGIDVVRDAFETGQRTRLGDFRGGWATSDGLDAIGSAVAVPVGQWGVLAVAAEAPDAFDETDAKVLETLAGALEAAFASVADEQQIRANERELRRQNEQLEEFAHVVAHDIRGPLTAARGFLEIALETDADEHFGRVADAHARMERMIDDLLTLARQGRSIAEREPVDLAALAETAWTQVRGDASVEIEAGLPVVSADASRLEEVLANLFRNAVEHADPGVTVKVGPLRTGEGDAVEGFFVEDDGPGIPAEKRPHIFDFGYTTDPTGTGLGLSIVEEVVEAHGWSVRATSGRDGGARFEIDTSGPAAVTLD
ncbi:PAS domain S-box protein [Halobellus rubicundus]|uniref:histidine kinase n=1 Tax=Halobellus rubicundus TaxID=2996466 RepID=A0ABD5MFQ1_9EURY